MSNLTAVKNYMGTDAIKNRFCDALGEARSRTFMASIVNAVSGNNSLQKCSPESILGAAFVAASLDLPVDQNLGYAAIVPYKTTAQFQMMYKGFVQLAVRSGQYKNISTSAIYADELESYDPIMEEIIFTSLQGRIDRDKGDVSKVVGYYAKFTLLTGFGKGLYMSMSAIKAHGKKYSASYQYDLRKKTMSSKWSSDFEVMALKTVLKLLLSRWGILSIDIQNAIASDQRVILSDKNGSIIMGDYVDNQKQQSLPTSSLDDKKPATVWDFEGDPESRIEAEKMTEIVKILDSNSINLDGLLKDLKFATALEIKNSDLKSISEYINNA